MLFPIERMEHAEMELIVELSILSIRFEEDQGEAGGGLEAGEAFNSIDQIRDFEEVLQFPFADFVTFNSIDQIRYSERVLEATAVGRLLSILSIRFIEEFKAYPKPRGWLVPFNSIDQIPRRPEVVAGEVRAFNSIDQIQWSRRLALAKELERTFNSIDQIPASGSTPCSTRASTCFQFYRSDSVPWVRHLYRSDSGSVEDLP